jgi:hypothetical protein
VERVKLDGDEYDTGNRRQNKTDAAAGASQETFRSLDTLDVDSKMTIREAIETNLLSGSLLGYPMVNTRVTVVDGRWSNLRSKNPLVF